MLKKVYCFKTVRNWPINKIFFANILTVITVFVKAQKSSKHNLKENKDMKNIYFSVYSAFFK